MKLEYIKQGLVNDGLTIMFSEEQRYSSRYKLSDYLTVVAYHNEDKNVYELQVLSVIGVDRESHYIDTIKVIDKCTNLLTDLTNELRQSLYSNLEIGKLNDITLDLEATKVSYKLTDNGLLDYRLIDNRSNFTGIPPIIS